MSRKFEIELVIDVEPGAFSWPARDEVSYDSGLGMNRAYEDLRRMSWAEAKRVLRLEQAFIDRIAITPQIEDEYDVTDTDFEEDEGLFGLDPGVASTVIALSAAGCIPFSSCNAGAFGGSHQEAYPLVAFYARSTIAPLLLSLATEVEVGLQTYEGGFLVVYSDEISKLRTFASKLINARVAVANLRKRAPPRRRKGQAESGQAELDLDG